MICSFTRLFAQSNQLNLFQHFCAAICLAVSVKETVYLDMSDEDCFCIDRFGVLLKYIEE